MPNLNSADDFMAAATGHFLVSHETLARLKIYAELLEKWQPKINLVSATTIPFMWERHFFDSAQLVKYLPNTPASIVDFGSGAGFPGLVLAAFDYQVTLIESDQKKTAFMQEVAAKAGLKNIRFINKRIEEISPFKVDFISARALSGLSGLLGYAAPYLALGAQALFLKGAEVNEELTLAQEKWHIDYSLHSSLSDKKAKLVHIRKASRR